MITKEMDLNNLLELKNKTNIIYGSGLNGKAVYESLVSKGITIAYFYDDDETRWGEEYCSLKILSRNELIDIAKTKSSVVNIIVSSIYIAQIEEKVVNLGFENIYTDLKVLLKRDEKVLRFVDYKNNIEYIKNLDILTDKFDDILSKRFFQIMKQSVIQGKAIEEMRELYTEEKQYFLKKFKGRLDEYTFLDAGAYTGDTVRELLNEGIKPKKVYCFEADHNNYSKLSSWINVQESNIFVGINLGLWDSHTMLGMKLDHYNARVTENVNEHMVECVTIDDYFKDIKIDYIKMDIEGAEQKALIGASCIIQI